MVDVLMSGHFVSRIIYSSHLLLRLKLRGISKRLPKAIYENAEERYFDSTTRLFIAIGDAVHKNRRREFAVAYKTSEQQTLLVTIHPLKIGQKRNRITSGRWKEL